MRINKDKIERRTMKVSAPEVEERAEMQAEQPMIVEGYAVVYDQPQTYQFGEETYTETIVRGACDNSDMRRTVMRYNHEDCVFALARTKNGSLQMMSDDYGLKIRAELIDTQSNRDVYKMIKSGLIDEMSFAFTVDDDEWTYSDDFKTVKRDIKSIDVIYDVSAVDTGFYENTSIYARAFESVDALKLEAEKAKQKLELEKARALALASA